MIFYENKSYSLYCGYGNDMTFPLHIHKELELLMVMGGEIEIASNAGTYTLGKGDISVVLPNTGHGYKTYKHSEHFIMIFNGSMLPLYKNAFTACKPSVSCIRGSQVHPEAYTSLKCIYEETRAGNNPGIITGHLYLAVSRLMPFLNLQKREKDTGNELIERILSYIQSNYQSPINLSSIAKELKVSPFHMSRVFSNSVGQRLDRYINELRINYANHLLACTDKPITEIAFECGFETLRTFNRVYKSVMSITPREYRKQQNNDPSTAL